MSNDDAAKPSRRDFLLVAASGAATVGVGLIAGWAVSREAGRGSGIAVPVDLEVSPDLERLSGSDEDAAPALNSFLKRAGREAVITGRYVTDSPVDLPHALTHLTLAAGSAIAVRGSHSAIARSGTIAFRERTKRTMKRGATSFTTPQPELYSENEYLLLSGDNRVENSRDRYGYLRRVTSVVDDTVYIDLPLPRVIDDSPRTTAVTLAPPVRIDGPGEVFSLDPKKSKNSLVTMRAVDRPEISGIEVHSSGGIGVTVAHCHGGTVDCTVRDLLDDGSDYFGYGVNVSGSTRDLMVAGYMTRVRHAVTTNAGSRIDNVGNAGEPENCTFAPRAENCSNKAIDTHRLGWGITMIPDVSGGNGGVQVRADNTTVRGGSIEGSSSGITISRDVVIAAVVENVAISGTESGIGIRCRGPALITDCTVSDSPGVAVELNDRSVVNGLDVRRGGAVGVMILGAENEVSNVSVGGSTTPVVQGDDASDNRVSLGYGRGDGIDRATRRLSRP